MASGFIPAYPNAFFVVGVEQLPRFVDAVSRLGSEADYAALAATYGVRRTDPRFWAHSDALHLTERYTRVDRDQLNYEVTIEDPKVLTKPYTQRTTLMLREGTRLREYSCAENNMDPKVYEKLLADPTLFMRSPEKPQ